MSDVPSEEAASHLGWHGEPETSEETAYRLAQSEGIELMTANNETGYKGVSNKSRGRDGRQTKGNSSFVARVKRDGKDVNLGSFTSAAEAALCYARYCAKVGYVHCASGKQRPGAEFGVGDSRYSADYATTGQPAQQFLTALDAEDGRNGVEGEVVELDDEASSVLVLARTEVAGSAPTGSTAHQTSGSSSSSPAALHEATGVEAPHGLAAPHQLPYKRRKKGQVTDEYETLLPLGASTLALAVPPGIPRNRKVRVSVTFSFE